MNFLIAGGAGSVGRDLTESLVKYGHRVRILDKNAESLAPHGGAVESIQGRLEDGPLVERALKGIDVVIHLAWSFSDDPIELLESDLKGHVLLLNASAAAKVSRFFYTSTAVVYGKPVHTPISEDDPCLVEDARKPFYAIAKLAAEKLTLSYGRMRELPVTIFRFWWSYGKEIGGRHLRDMIARAQAGQPLQVPEGAGGSFLDHDDLVHALLLSLQERESIGQLFNLATAYLTWKDIAHIIRETTASASPLEVIPAREWKGPQFLADPWELSTAKAQRLFGYRSLFPGSKASERIGQAIGACCATMERPPA